MLPPLPFRAPAALGEQAVDIGQRAVTVDKEPEALAVGLTGGRSLGLVVTFGP